MIKKIVFSLVFAVSLALFGASDVKAMTAAEIQAMIQQLQAQIAALQKQLAEIQQTPVSWCYNFNTNLGIGSKGPDVLALKEALAKEGILPDQEFSDEFDEYAASYIVEFQEKYKEEILSPFKMKRGNGYVGKLTRAKLNKLYGCAVSAENKPPVISSVEGPSQLSVNEKGAWTINAYDPEGTNLVYYVSWGDGAVESPTENKTFTYSYHQVGIYTIQISVGDKYGLSAKKSLSVNVVSKETKNNPPKFSDDLAVWKEGKAGEWVNFKLKATDSDGDELGWSVEWGDGSGVVSNSCPYPSNYYYGNKSSWTNEFGHIWTKAGTYSVKFTANDCRGGAAPFYVKVFISSATTTAQTPTTPVITGSTSVNAGQPANYSFESTVKNLSSIDFFITWGDGTAGEDCVAKSAIKEALDGTQTFVCSSTHTYSQNGIYVIRAIASGVNVANWSGKGSVSVKVSAIPSITVLSPNGGEKWVVGNTYEIKWLTDGFSQNLAVQIDLLQKKIGDSQYWNIGTIASGVNAANGSYKWTITNEKLSYPDGATYQILVKQPGESGLEKSDKSDGSFSIVSTTTVAAPSISSISPTYGYQGTDAMNMTIIGYNFSGAGDFSGCGISPVSDRGFQLVSCKVISDSEIEAKFSISNDATIGKRSITVQTPKGGKSNAANFSINPTFSSITVLSPNGGEKWTIGSAQTIKWNSTGFNYVLIDLIRGDGASGSFTSSAQPGQFVWQVPSHLSAGNDYKIRVMGIDSLDSYNEAGKSDLSDNYFSIVAATTTTATCAGLKSSAATNYYFNLCKDYSYDKVCFNKNTSLYQGCGQSSRDDCTAYNTNAAQNIWCDTGFISSAVNITGRLVDRTTSLPVSNAAIYTENSASGQALNPVYTGSNGEFSFSTSKDFSASAAKMFSFWPSYFIQGSIILQKTNSGELIAKADLFGTYSDIQKTVTGEKVDLGNISLWPAVDINISSDIAVRFSIDYNTGAGEIGGGGNSNYKTSHTLSNAIPLNYDVRVALVDSNGISYTSPYTKLPLSNGSKPLQVNFLNKQFSFGALTPSVTVVSPNGGETLVGGQTKTIQYKTQGINNVLIKLCALTPLLEKGYTCHTLPGIPDSGVSAASGSFNWQIDSNDPFIPCNNACKIEVYEVRNGIVSEIFDVSDNYFTIAEATTAANLPPDTPSISGPILGKVGESIAWTFWSKDPDGGGNYLLTFTINWGDGSSGNCLSSYVAGVKEATCYMNHSWSQPGDYTVSVKVKDSQGGESSASMPPLKISKAIVLSSPNGGENWKIDSAYDITWKSYGLEKVDIEITKNNLYGWNKIFSNIFSSDGKVNWRVEGEEPGDFYKIHIWDSGDTAITDSSDNYFTVSYKYPGFFMSADKSNYSEGETINLTIKRADGKTFPYAVDLYGIEMNKNPETRISIAKGLEVTSANGLLKTINTALEEPFKSGGANSYMLLICAAGEECVGGVNTNSMVVNYKIPVTFINPEANQMANISGALLKMAEEINKLLGR